MLRHWLTPGDAAAAALCASRGYRLVRREFHLERPLDTLRAPVIPEHVRIRPFRAGDERALHRVNEVSFAEHWGFRSSTFDEWWARSDGSAFETDLVWVAVRDGRPVGELWLQVYDEGRGWVEILGVIPDVRGRGIGRALLRTGFAELARRGCRRALLGADAGNESGALRLYESEGMTVRREWHVVEKRLG
jgi:mycothiol synthase